MMWWIWSLQTWACPAHASCLQVPIQTSLGLTKLDVQKWSPPQKNAEAMPLYFVAGGPGQSGLDVAPYLAPSLFTLGRDIVFYTPLGTQKENNPFPCFGMIGSLQNIYSPEREVSGCVPKEGFDVSEYSSVRSAHHIEQIRQQLGDEKIVLLGSSYGSRVAQIYVQLYPEHVDSLIIDSGIPLHTFIGSSFVAEQIFRKRLGTSGMAIVDKIEKKLPEDVVFFDVSIQDDVMLHIDLDSFRLSLHNQLYRYSDQLNLYSLVEEIHRGNWDLLLRKLHHEQQKAFSLGTYLSVFCQEDWLLLCAQETEEFFPFCSYMTKQCRLWPQKSNREWGQRIEHSVPALILHGTEDPVSSISYAVRLQHDWPLSLRVEFTEEAHGVLLSSCGIDVLKTFLSVEDTKNANLPTCADMVRIYSSRGEITY